MIMQGEVMTERPASLYSPGIYLAGMKEKNVTHYHTLAVIRTV
jgi:hypothetical protein